MSLKKLLTMSLILLFLVVIINAEETTPPSETPVTEPSVEILQQGMTSVIDEDSGITTYTFSEDDSVMKIGNAHYFSVKPESEENPAYLKADNEGNVIEADLTAEKRTTWKFGERSLELQEGQRVTFKDGKIEVFGKEGEEVGIKTSPDSQDYERVRFIQDTSVGGLDFDRNQNPLQIQDNHITGKNFEVAGLRIQEGGATLKENGVLLDANSASSYNQVKITNRETLLFSNSDDFGTSENALFMGSSDLKARGSGFDLEFDYGNPYAKIESGDHFKLSAENNIELTLRNRDVQGKIPSLDIKGDFIIEQNSKIYKTSNNKFIVDQTLYPNSGTSPIELKIAGQDRKYLVSNFKGVSAVSLDAEAGITDEKYANSIYPKRASTELRYNYPTAKDFEEITGGKLNFLTEGIPSQEINGVTYPGISREDMLRMMDNPQDMRVLIDYYQTLPDSAKGGISTINVYGVNEFYEVLNEGGGLPTALAFYNNQDNSINIKGVGFAESCSGNICSFGLFSHESSHAIDKHLFDLSQEDFNTFSSSWQDLNGKKKGTSFLDSSSLKKLDFRWKSGGDPLGPNRGYVSPYGALNDAEDRAEYLRIIKSDPSFFNKNNLFDEKNPYSSTYRNKVELLFEKGFISQTEYDSVFN